MSKVVLVTGSNRGIGRSTIIEFAKAGLDVVINYCHHKEEAYELKDLGFARVPVKEAVEKLDNPYTLKPARNVPLMLFTLSIVSMILFSITLFF